MLSKETIQNIKYDITLHQHSENYALVSCILDTYEHQDKKQENPLTPKQLEQVENYFNQTPKTGVFTAIRSLIDWYKKLPSDPEPAPVQEVA